MKKYDAYKPSGIEWIGEVPEEWGIIPFKHCVGINNGADYKDVETDDESAYPVVGSGGVFAYATEYMYDGEVIFLGRKGTVDRPLYYKGKFWAIDTMFYAIPKNKNNGKYLYYQSLTFPFDYYLTNTARPSMTQTDLGDNKICLPPLNEQAAIVDYLDAKCAKIDNVVTIQQKRIVLLKELKQSIITRAVTKGLDKNTKMKDSGIEWIGQMPAKWGTIHIKRTCVCKNGLFIDGDWIESKDLAGDSGTIRYLTSGNVGVIKYKEQGDGYITEEKFNELLCTEVLPGDILISRLNEPIGRACIVPDLNSKIVCAVDNVICRPDDSLYDRRYLVYQMNCRAYSDYTNCLARGTGMHRISRAMLGQISILVPSLSEQTAIADYLDKKCAIIDRQIAKIEKQIDLLNEYKQSVITECVTGKRKVC